MSATKEKTYLKWYQKLAYGAGDLASNCSYGLVASFVLLYLTGTMGLDSAIIGSLMLASKDETSADTSYEEDSETSAQPYEDTAIDTTDIYD